jgi:hypothetical protein
MCSWRRTAVLLIVLFLPPPAAALAQWLPYGPITADEGRIAVSGDVTATFGRSDGGIDGRGGAFFNYTDYEHNALRMFRVSLSGRWHPTERVAFLTEVRSEDLQRAIPYALYVRLRPWASRAFDIQAGRIPPVFGAFARRSYGSDNPLIGYPLAYQYLTSIRADAVPRTADDLLFMRAWGWRANYPVGAGTSAPGVPLVSSYRWDTGVQAHAASERLEGAIALTKGTLSNPRVGDDNRGLQVSGRVAWKPIVGLEIGASAARGAFLTGALEDTLAAAGSARTHTQRVLGLDAEYSRDYWIVRGEIVDSRWNLPALAAPFLGPVSARGSYVETRYRLTPRFFAAARADQLTFSRIQGQFSFNGQPTPWDAPVSRIEAGGGMYIQRNLTVRAVLQRNWRALGGPFSVRRQTCPSAQLAFWF